MSEYKEILAASVSRLFRESTDLSTAAQCNCFSEKLWHQIEELGLPLLLVPERVGGVGGDWEDAFALMHALGRYAVPLPVGEAIVASHFLTIGGIDLSGARLSIACEVENAAISADGTGFSGRLLRVPWGRCVTSVVTIIEHQNIMKILCLPVAQAQITAGENCAGEPRDTLVFNQVKPLVAVFDASQVPTLFECAALLRVAQISGAMEAALGLSIEYAKQRKQFGRPISQFQAVQQQLALFGADSAACNSAAHSAFRAVSRLGRLAAFAIGAAKLRANLAIGVATATAHQIHAAIGFTREYRLRHYTQRLWAWRSEYGNDRHWSERLGDAIAGRGAENFWADLTAADDAAALFRSERRENAMNEVRACTVVNGTM